jgi:hypothetical protein
MRFANKHGIISGSGIIHFGRLVNRLLGASSVVTKDMVAQESASWIHHTFFEDQEIFNLSAYVADTVTCVGPSLGQILSVLDAEDEWREQIQQNFPADLGNAYRDNDSLMQVLLDSEIDESDMLSFPTPFIGGKPTETLQSMITKRNWERARKGAMVDEDEMMVWKTFKGRCQLPCRACIRLRDSLVKTHLGRWASWQGRSKRETRYYGYRKWKKQ